MSERKGKIRLGLDIGGTAIKSVAVAESGEIVDHFKTPSFAKTKGEAGVYEAIDTTLKHHKERDILSIGIGCAGSVDHANGVVINSPNFADWKNVPLQKWVAEKHDLPVKIDNDANCAVLAAWKLGKAKGFNHVLLLTLGTGIGGGLILDGRPYRGAHGAASELGHVSIYADGVECPCGNRGCFERYCSGSTLKEKCPGFTTKQILSDHDKEPFKSVVSKFIEDLQVGITGLANAFDPEIIVLGGGISDGLLWAFPQIETWVKKHAFPIIGQNVRLVHAEHGNWAGAIGAALL